MKKLLGVIFGVVFAMVIMPKMAKFSLAAKYKKPGVAYAAEANKPSSPTCATLGSKTNNIGEVAMRIKCRGDAP